MKIDFKIAFFFLALASPLYFVEACSGSRRKPAPPPKNVCPLTTYRGSEFTGKTLRVENGFLGKIQTIKRYAGECNVRIYITSSYRSTTRVSGAIVPPASRSNHLIGHAIDMNVIDRRTGRFCNSRCLSGSNRPLGVNCFIGKIESDSGLRWGGNFTPRDTVHIDDGTNVRNRALYDQIFKSIQQNC